MALFLFTIFVDRIKKICYYLEKYLNSKILVFQSLLYEKYGNITVQKLFNIWLFPSVIHGP